MNIKDIARLCGVSIATVSRVINNKPEGISEEKRKYIQKIIADTGYRPSGLARGLVTKKTSTIGLIISDITNPLYPLMARGVEDCAQANKYSMVLCNTNSKPEREKKYINYLMEKGVDGVILSISHGADEEHVNEIFDCGIPIVLIDEPVINRKAYGVFTDNFKGGYIATKHLIEQGHERIACIIGPYDSLTSTERLEGYKKAITEAGLSVDESIIMSGDYKEETGYKLISEIISSRKDVTAVFAANDSIAIGIYKAIKAFGLKIPKDYSIVGFDDVYDMDLIEPALTSVSMPIYDMGMKAVEMLIKILNDTRPRKKAYIFEPELIIRNSTRKLNSNSRN